MCVSDRETQRDRETERQRDRETERQSLWQTWESEREREIENVSACDCVHPCMWRFKMTNKHWLSAWVFVFFACQNQDKNCNLQITCPLRFSRKYLLTNFKLSLSQWHAHGCIHAQLTHYQPRPQPQSEAQPHPHPQPQPQPQSQFVTQ